MLVQGVYQNRAWNQSLPLQESTASRQKNPPGHSLFLSLSTWQINGSRLESWRRRCMCGMVRRCQNRKLFRGMKINGENKYLTLAKSRLLIAPMNLLCAASLTCFLILYLWVLNEVRGSEMNDGPTLWINHVKLKQGPFMRRQMPASVCAFCGVS